MNRNVDLFRSFRLDPNAIYWGEVHDRYAARIQNAVQSRQMLGVVGPFGSGKSVLVREALRDQLPDNQIIYVQNFDRESLTIGHIVSQIIRDLGGSESPRRDMNARCIQLGRIVGEHAVVQGKDIAVVIENSHRIHANTLLALKDARESATYKGYDELFSCVLVGQEPLAAKLDRFGEVKYRSRQLTLSPSEGWMTHEERMRYLDAIYGDVIEPEVAVRLAALYETPLELDYHIEDKLAMMQDAGIDRMTPELIDFSIREQREAMGVSLRDLEKVTGVAKSTISDVEHGKNQSPETRAQIEQGIDELVREQTADKTPA
jgi:type II secretory pathway predicted ATPase ExeA/DNA-binding XRE family transcriptional regulator